MNKKRLGQARRKIVSMFFASAITMLPACHIPGLRQADNTSLIGSEYSAATNSDAVSTATTKDPSGAENSGLQAFNQFYTSPTLATLITQVLQSNRELKILEEEIQVAANDVRARRGVFLPMFTFGAEAGFDQPGEYTRAGAVESQLEIRPGQAFPAPLGGFAYGLNFFMPLDIWREYRNARDAAYQRYLASIEKRNDLTNRLIGETAETYYRLLALDRRLENLDQIIAIQNKSLELAKSRKEAGRDTELPVQRFQAEVRKNESEKLIVKQEIIEAENRLNVLAYRAPQRIERNNTEFTTSSMRPLNLGVPTQLLVNRPDIRQAERELAATELDILVARARFFPKIDIVGGLGWESFNPRYLFFTPEALAYNLVGNLVVPVVNRAAIKADYQNANARQLQALYNYQQTILTAYAEVVNRISMAENFRKSIVAKEEQIKALETSVEVATKLFQNARVEYVEVLLAQRDLLDSRMNLIGIQQEQLKAIVSVYQALGGGATSLPNPDLVSPTGK